MPAARRSRARPAGTTPPHSRNSPPKGRYARSINGDAFSDKVKQVTIDTIKQDLGKVDLVVYSPRHRAARTRRRAKPSARRSPIGKTVTFRGLDTDKEVIRDVTLEPATQEEIDGTVAVMGGEDWQMWIDALDEAGVLADGAKTTAFTYLGEQITHDIYWNGSIGEAKKDLDKKVLSIRDKLVAHGGDARVSVLKAVVTQASSAIPMMPLYLSLLFKTMKEAGTHEGCIEQVYGLFKRQPVRRDAARRRRRPPARGLQGLDPQVQAKVVAQWNHVTNENLYELTDFTGYKTEFLRLFGFEIAGVDYDADVNPDVKIPGIIDTTV